MRYLAAVIAAIIAIGCQLWPADAQAPTPPQIEPYTTIYKPLPVPRPLPKLPTPLDEFIGLKIPAITWTLKVAKCETGLDPRHVGRAAPEYGEGATFRGAFGYWTTSNGSGTFEEYGGRELSGTVWADQAPLIDQIVVFYRIRVTGYQHPDGRYVPPVGIGANNCKRYAGPVTWVLWK